MEFRVLGALEVLHAGRALPLGGRKQRAVLARLLLDAGQAVSTDALISAVWGENPPAHARGTLQVYVANLRRVLDINDGVDGDHRRLQRRPSGYLLNLLPGDELDMHRFRRLSRKGRLLMGHDPPSAASLLRSSLETWTGTPFPDLTDGADPPPEVAGLEEERLVALEDRIEADINSGAGSEAVAELERLVAEHPLRERFHAHRIVALYRAGRQADALEAYRRARTVLREELGIDPGPALQRLERAVLEQDPMLLSVVPAVRSLPTLPETPNPIIGRQAELGDIVSLLKDESVRLVTLIGPGGTGKTRLALEVAKALQPDFAAGVFFVALGAVREPALVLSTIATTLNVKEVAGRPLSELIHDRLDRQHALVVIDNLEHLLPAAQLLSDLLAHTRDVKLLATSRAALRISAEHEYPLGPLPLPPVGRATSVQELGCNEAVALFRERARAVLPHFDLDGENAPAIAATCRHLDGLPLAIELAAARIRVLPPEAILGRLDARLRLLTGGARDVPRRQQTLRNTIEWSYELLNDDERALFARLGVFAGGCQLDAVEALCADAGAEDQVLEWLDSLVSQSLVQFRQAPGEVPRFTMLETIHAFARELLQSSGQAAGLRSAHARHYLCLAESAAPHLVGGEQLQWVSRLSGEQDNLRAALDWAVGTDGDGSVALRLAGALWPFWEMAGLLQEGQRWLGMALAHADGAPSPALMRACSGAGTLAWDSGDDVAAADWHERALSLARRLRDRHEEAFALNNLGAVHADRDEYPQAESLYAQAADLALRVGARRTYGMTLHNTAEIYFHRGELDRAAHTYEEALAVFREIGDEWLINASLRGLAMTGLRLGDQERATLALHQSLRLAAQLGENNWVAENFEGLAAVAQHAGCPQQAARLLAAAEALRSRIGVPIQLPDRPDVDALTLEVRRELTDEALHVAWEAGRSVAIAAMVGEVLQEAQHPK